MNNPKLKTMSAGSLSTLLNKFRYQERSKKFLVDGKQHADDTSMTSSRSNVSPSNSSTFATLSSPSLNSQGKHYVYDSHVVFVFL